MKLITNIKPPFLSDIIFKELKSFKKIKAAVAYCKSYDLFDHCKKHKIKLAYFARLDRSVNLDLKGLQSFLTNNISIHIIGGDKFHPKVIWCDGFGAYIGSANLTQSAWHNNIECGLWLTQKELKDNSLIDSLNAFFKFIQKKSTPLKGISKQVILELDKLKQAEEKKRTNTLSSSKKAFRMIKDIGVFEGLKNRSIKAPMKKVLSFEKHSSDGETYQKRSIWNDQHEIRCLRILRLLQEERFPKGRRSELCRKMSRMKGSVPSFNSISSKVSNYEYLDTKGKKGLSNASKDTKRIYKKYKTASVKTLRNLLFFEKLRSELRTKKEIEEFKIGKPIGKDRNGIDLNFKQKTKYKGYIRIFRPENLKYGGHPYITIYYTWRGNIDNKAEFKSLKKRMRQLKIKDRYKPDSKDSFKFIRWGWEKTEEKDRQWIIDGVIDLLKALN